MRVIFPITMILTGLLTMAGGAALVFEGGTIRGLWTVVAITIGVGFVTANFGRVALAAETNGNQMLRCAVCAVVHLSYALLLLFFMSGLARAGGNAMGIAGLILPVSLACVVLNLCRFAILYRREAGGERRQGARPVL